MVYCNTHSQLSYYHCQHTIQYHLFTTSPPTTHHNTLPTLHCHITILTPPPHHLTTLYPLQAGVPLPTPRCTRPPSTQSLCPAPSYQAIPSTSELQEYSLSTPTSTSSTTMCKTDRRTERERERGDVVMKVLRNYVLNSYLVIKKEMSKRERERV